GLGNLGDGPAAVAQRLADSGLRQTLVASLDDWAACAQKPSRQAWVLGVARRADADPRRDRLRDPAVWRDKAALARLAKRVPAERVTPQLLVGLGGLLGRAGEKVLRAGQARHPG